MPFGADEPAPKRKPRKRLAIVSSWNENCGNASYTYALKAEFERHYDVTVLPLDLFLLQKRGRAFVRLGDDHIADMARELKKFDFVNIQFEAGLYGARVGDIRRRIFRLLDAAPNLILTMHRVDLPASTWIDDALVAIYNVNLKRFFASRYRSEFPALYERIVLHCRKLSKRGNVWIKVHTKRERRVVEAAFKMQNVVDYPLAVLNAETRRRVHGNIDPDVIRDRYGLPPATKMMGAFGYISDYKGFETLVEAISVLPSDWYLLIVGSQHPQSIQAWTEIDPYLGILLRQITGRGHDTGGKGGGQPPRLRNIPAEIRVNATIDQLPTLRADARALMDRVRFVGNVDDEEFTFMLRNMDATVLPYLEVGQSMSGVLALAVESGARLFASNNLSFAEARRYYGQVYSNFDIGNFVEVAQKVRFDKSAYDEAREKAFARYNIVRSINLHRHLFEHCRTPTQEWMDAEAMSWEEVGA